MNYITSKNLFFQLPRVLTHVKRSLNGMQSYNPEDVLFLLNKWDTLYQRDVDLKEMLFDEAKLILRKTWRKVDDSSIFKIAVGRVFTFSLHFF